MCNVYMKVVSKWKKQCEFNLYKLIKCLIIYIPVITYT